MKKRVFSLALTITILSALLVAVAPASATADTDNALSMRFLSAIQPPTAGSIPISNRAELAAISNDLKGEYHLTTDIDLSDGAWVPIGTIGYSFGRDEFSGVFDGQGHVLRNLTIIGENNTYAGLFGAATKDAVIKNVALDGVDIDISGFSINGFPTNLRPIGGGSVINYDALYGLTAGGICGYGGNISNCYVIGSISASSISTYNSGPWSHRTVLTGGISGYGGTIGNCYFIGSLSSTTNGNGAHSYAGGISGFIETNSYFGDGSISNCYSVANLYVSATTSYFAGTVSTSVGGICGYSGGNATVRNSYWNTESVQNVDGVALTTSDKKGLGSGVGQATALTSEQMRFQSSFSSWDFSNIWTYRSGVNDGYPVLRAFFESPSSWADADVSRAIALGLVQKSIQSKYTQATSRAEFCTLAVALYETVIGNEITERQSFSDTNDVNVQKAAAIGVVQGIGGNRFDPNASLTREQAATMLARLAKAVENPLSNQTATFSDNGSISPWAIEAVGQMQATGIMGGVGGNRFTPKDPYTREQSITTIIRLYDIVAQ